MALSVKDTLSTWSKIRTMSDLGGVIRGNQGIGGVASTVGTMHATASMVNVNGPVRGTPTGPNGTVASGGAGGKPPTTGGIVTAGTKKSCQRT